MLWEQHNTLLHGSRLYTAVIADPSALHATPLFLFRVNTVATHSHTYVSYYHQAKLPMHAKRTGLQSPL